VDHEIAIAKIKDWIPLKKTHKDNIFKQFAEFTHATVYGQFIVALAQGAVATIAYFAFGISSPLVWGLLTAFFALIPFIGTGIIWIPMGITLLINAEIARGIGLLLVGVLIISSIDNFMKPRIIGKRTRLHPVLVLVGVVGGLLAMGLIGIVVGPLIISLLISFIEVYHKERKR
jgi:predicted PurR-regulated permease PerM